MATQMTPRMPQVRQPTSAEDLLPNLRTVVTRKAGRTMHESLGLVPGERVLMITDSTVSPLLSEAFGEAIRDAGGHVDTVNLEGYPLLEDPIDLVDGPNTSRWYPEWVWEASKQADVLLCLAFFKFPHTPNLPWGRRNAYGANWRLQGRAVQWELPPDMVLAPSLTYPLEVWDAIDERTYQLIKDARRITIREDNGTHLTWDLTHEDWAAIEGRRGDEGGPASGLPYVPGHLFIPFPKSLQFEGEIMINSLTFGGPVEPTRLTVDGRRVTQVDGDSHFANRLRETFEKHKNDTWKGLPGPGANWISTFAACTNPKFRRSPNFESMRGSARVHSWCLGHRRSGFLHASVGAALENENSKLIRHFDMMFPNLYADDRPVIEDGHLLALDDPSVRAVAERYGNPDELLREDWVPDRIKGI
jgi:hypothetical protein